MVTFHLDIHWTNIGHLSVLINRVRLLCSTSRLFIALLLTSPQKDLSILYSYGK